MPVEQHRRGDLPAAGRRGPRGLNGAPDSRPAGDEDVAAGWAWLATLPRATSAHAERGADPQAVVRGLLAELGDPQDELRVIHIAGSKGKGSTALFAEALLGELGQRTFTFTSPHLERWTERLRLDGAEAPPARSRAALDAVRGAGERTGLVPGFFEALTVAGLWLAREAGVDWCVIECGVGGRADATNVIHPAVSVITGIEREHVDRLGDTLIEIAGEKAGIVKPGAPLVAPRLAPELDAVLAERAARAGSVFLRVERCPRSPTRAVAPDTVHWHYATGALTVAGPGWRVQGRLASPGVHMAGNAALAITAVGQLGLASAESLQRVARVLARNPLPGRMETLSALPWVIADGAHTGASASALAETVTATAPSRVHLLLSCSTGKDIDAMLEPLLRIADVVTTTRADPTYSISARELAERVATAAPRLDVRAIDSVDRALASACDDHPGRTLVLATGSVYLAGAVRAAFAREAAEQ